MTKRANAVERVLFRYAAHFPMHRGKARALDAGASLLGPRRLRLENGLEFALRLNSSMDLAFLRTAGSKQTSLVHQLVAQLEPGDCFIDVGANIGFHTIEAARRVGDQGLVIAVEPSAREYARLLNAIEWNRCQNVIALRAALGDRNGHVRLDVEAAHTGLNHISSEGTESVALFRGDAVLPALVGNRRTWIKIDVEGAEPLVIEGLKGLLEGDLVRALVVELTPTMSVAMGLDVAAATATLVRLGFAQGPSESSGAGRDTWFARPDVSAPRTET